MTASCKRIKKMNLSQKEKALRLTLEPVVKELMRVTTYPTGTCWGIVRRQKLIEKYGAEFCCTIMQRFQPNTCLPLILGAIKKEYLKTVDCSTLQIPDTLRIK